MCSSIADFFVDLTDCSLQIELSDRSALRLAARINTYCNDHPFHPEGTTDMPPSELTYIVRISTAKCCDLSWNAENTHGYVCAPLPSQKMAPSDLELVQVQVAVRHGDRTALYDPFQNPREYGQDECSLQTSIGVCAARHHGRFARCPAHIALIVPLVEMCTDPLLSARWEELQYSLSHGFEIVTPADASEKLQQSIEALKRAMSNIEQEYTQPVSRYSGGGGRWG